MRNLFSQIIADAANDQWMESAYAQSINDANFNELELSVLQYICRNGYTWENDIKKFLIKNFPVSSSADEMCLDKLCDLVIRDTDPVETAVSFCYKKNTNYGYGSYCFYSPAPELSVSIFDKLHARQFNADDLPYFKKFEQERLCRQWCIDASTHDEKLTALKALEKLPKKAIVRFVQTEECLNFFRCLDGDARLYASSMLNKCKDKDCRHLSKELAGE